MRRYGLFVLLLAILFAFPAAVNAAERDKQNTVVKCEKPAVEYLKDAERLYRNSFPGDKTYMYTNTGQNILAVLKFYEICSELERNKR